MVRSNSEIVIVYPAYRLTQIIIMDRIDDSKSFNSLILPTSNKNPPPDHPPTSRLPTHLTQLHPSPATVGGSSRSLDDYPLQEPGHRELNGLSMV